MNYWSRDNTKEWIVQLEHRIQDIGYYLDKTLEWCEDYGIEDKNVIFTCSFLTCIWVSNMRGESITFIELMEMLGVEHWNCTEEKVYELDECWENLDFHEFLEQVIAKYNSANDKDYE